MRADDIQECIEPISITWLSSDDKTEAVETALDHSPNGQTKAMYVACVTGLPLVAY
jgi:hypothetical protein